MTDPTQMLSAYNQALERLLEIFTAPNILTDDKICQVQQFCAAYLDLPVSVIGEIQDDQYELIYAIDPSGLREAGKAYQLDETFCSIAITSEEPIAVQSIPNSEYRDFSSCASGEIRSYIGAPIRVSGSITGAIAFVGAEDRDKPFEPSDITLVKLVANWLSGQFETMARTKGLIQSERRFKRLYRKLPLVAFTYDRDLRITDVSDFMLGCTGYTRDELIGSRSVDLVAKEVCRDTLAAEHKEFWETGIASCVPRLIETKSGQVLEFELSTVAFEGPDGNFDSGHAVMLDVTERNRAQGKLALKNEKLEKVNEQLRHFAYIASHDLQEPLRKIRMFGDQLSEETNGELSSEGEFALDTMISAAERLSNLVTDVLAFSRVSYAEFSIHKVDISDVVAQVLTAMEEKIDEIGANIEIGDLPIVQGDPVQLNRLLMNLIGNAIKYRRPNSIVKIEIAGHFDPLENATEITVSDNGIGFSNDYAEKIFQPFLRLNQRSMYSGSGIGLAVAQSIVEKHGWGLTASGKPGIGSVFTIRLPGVQMHSVKLTAASDEVA